MEIRKNLQNINIDHLSWKDPIASQVISDDSNIIQNLSANDYYSFMKLAKQMQMNILPNNVQRQCNQFIIDFKNENINLFCSTLKHDNTWKETNKELGEITKKILYIL